jgi:hypothetical protein
VSDRIFWIAVLALVWTLIASTCFWAAYMIREQPWTVQGAAMFALCVLSVKSSER